MHKPDPLSCRQALSALAATAALVATGVGVAALPAEPDAALKATYARWRRKEAEVEQGGLSDEEWDRHVDELTVIEREIYACPAESMEGLAIKADVATQYLNPASGVHMDDMALGSLFADIKALASAASVSAA
jgi:hypothetical protein